MRPHALIAALSRAEAYPDRPSRVSMRQTHISWLLFAAPLAADQLRAHGHGQEHAGRNLGPTTRSPRAQFRRHAQTVGRPAANGACLCGAWGGAIYGGVDRGHLCASIPGGRTAPDPRPVGAHRRLFPARLPSPAGHAAGAAAGGGVLRARMLVPGGRNPSSPAGTGRLRWGSLRRALGADRSTATSLRAALRGPPAAASPSRYDPSASARRRGGSAAARVPRRAASPIILPCRED
jgi:hypothetical protein